MTAPSTRPTPLRDLRRAREIVRILVAHGFGALLRRDRIGEETIQAELPQDAEAPPTDASTLAARVRALLEALGPTFVKLGQILSTRPDVVPGPVADALEALQDQAPRVSLDDVRGVVEEELGRPLDEVFAAFEPEPLATASIAQVHRARLLVEGEEREVVVKVQRPGIRDVMEADLSLLYWLARVLEGTIEEVSAYSPTTIVQEFERALSEELDFEHERGNLERARRNFERRGDLLVIPDVFAEACSSRVLTMSFLAGVKITATKDDPRYDRQALLERLVEITYQQVFDDGFFHADPHPGNVLVLPDGRIGMIDYGMWGRLSAAQQEVLIDLLTAIALKSPSMLTRLAMRVGEVPPGFDRRAFEQEVRELLDRYVGVQIQELSSGTLIADAVDVIRRHRIRIPPEFALVSRGTATLEGIIRDLYPDLDFQALVLPYVKRLLLRRIDLASGGTHVLSLLVGLQAFVNEVPGQIDQLLDDLSSGRFQVHLRQESLAGLETAGRVQSVRQLLGTLAAALVLGAAITTLAPDPPAWRGVPILPVVGLLLAGLCLYGVVLTFVFPRGWRRIRLSRLLFWRR